MKKNWFKEFFRVIKFASRERLYFTFTVITTISLSVMSLVIPWVYKGFFDIIESSYKSGAPIFSSDRLFHYFLLYIFVLTIQTIISLLNNYAMEVWWFKAINKIQKEVYEHLQSLSLEFFENTPTGKILERIKTGVYSIVQIYHNFMLKIATHFLFTIFALIILLNMNIWFGVLMLIATPLYIVINLIHVKIWMKRAKENRKKWEKLSTFLVESVTNVRVVKSFAREDRQISSLVLQLKSLLRLAKERMKISVRVRFLRTELSDITRVAAVFLALYLIDEGQFTLGSLVVATTYVSKVLDPISEIMWQLENIQEKLVDTSLLFAFMDEKPNVVDAVNPKKLKGIKGEIIFDNVLFKYKNKPVINNFSLIIPPNSSVALIGRSGVGKSTLVKLLLRFYDSDKGNIFVDGKNIKEVTQKSLRENISTVMQDALLFNDTVYRNIGFGKLGASRQEIIDAAKKANAHDFIMKLPKNYNTVIGERGVKLSGGEQQRINIARAFLKDAPIIVLDEATSSLDSESEILIQEALKKLVSGKTAIVIAHRLSTVMWVDKIIVIEKGRMKESGTHQDLVKKEGVYARLFGIQSGGYLK